MTRPRISPSRELFGILGSLENTSEVLKAWNSRFEEEGIDAYMDRYTTTSENLPERLSEMFHFDRRGYIVSSSLEEAVVPLLDEIEGERVNTVFNDRGVLKGSFINEPFEVCDGKRWKMWLVN